MKRGKKKDDNRLAGGGLAYSTRNCDPRQIEYGDWHASGFWVEVRIDSPPVVPNPEVVRLELIDSDAPRCRRPGCQNRLTGRQLYWCNAKTCGNAMRQQRHRDLAKLEFRDVDLISEVLDDPQHFQKEVARAQRQAARPVAITETISVERQIVEVFNEAARKP